MVAPSKKELNESIGLLKNYRDRLKEEITTISQKLRMPESKINSSIKNNDELNRAEKLIEELSKQLKST